MTRNNEEYMENENMQMEMPIIEKKIPVENCQDEECERIDNYRHKFFEFNDRINHNTHLNDAVDNINITNKASDYMIGKTIAEIYDDLVNTNAYKTVEK